MCLSISMHSGMLFLLLWVIAEVGNLVSVCWCLFLRKTKSNLMENPPKAQKAECSCSHAYIWIRISFCYLCGFFVFVCFLFFFFERVYWVNWLNQSFFLCFTLFSLFPCFFFVYQLLLFFLCSLSVSFVCFLCFFQMKYLYRQTNIN